MGGGNRREGFFGRRAGSQPYASSYRVVPEMLREDKKDPDIYVPGTGYFKNPTRTVISAETAHNNAFYLSGEERRKIDDWYEYVVDLSGRLIVDKRCNPNNPAKRAPHPTLIGGMHPRVRYAGMMHFKDGKIDDFNGDSGHYRPAEESLNEVMRCVRRIFDSNPYLLHRTSHWRKKWRKQKRRVPGR